MLNKNLSKNRNFDFSDHTYAPGDLKIILKLQVLIEEHFKGNRYGTYYSDLMQMPLFKLNKLCMEYLDKTLYQLINERRQVEMVDLLLNTSLTIKEITCQLGFINQAYFNKYFRRVTGESPAAFRRILE